MVHRRGALKPTGRLVVGEFFDRHYIPLITLLRHASATGFEPATHIGLPVAYFARLRPAP